MARQINAQTIGMRSQMKFCTPAQLSRLHNAALHILERTGLVIHCSEALDLLGEIGCWRDKGQRVRIPSHIVDQALARTPGRISVYNRQGDPAMLLEGLNSYYGPGPTIQYVYDAYSRKRRISDREDIQRAATVCDYLPNIDFAMTMGMTGGVDPKSKGINPALTDRLDFAAMLGHTQKPLIFSAWSREGLADIWDMAVAVRGSEEQAGRQPLMILFTQPISPLVIDTEPVRQLFFCAEKGIPAIFSSAPTMGSTAPNSIAGSVAQALAEFFGALVLSQFKNPGAPVIMGAGYGPMDFRKASSPYNGPEFYVSKTINKELAAYYGLPDWNYGGCTDAKILDGQATAEAALSLYVATSAGSNLIHDVGYMEMGMTACLELLVMADELISGFKKMFAEIPMDDESLGLDVIDRVGPGAHFLTENHTLDRVRRTWHPKFFDRDSFAGWEEAGSLTMETKLNRKLQWILENHRSEPLAPEVRKEIEAVIARAGNVADG
jgi:trimethylamine--corrinoid protein Co-methyltransferase